jgi:hypothetical protein
MAPARDKREYGLTEQDRAYEITRKFGVINADRANALLASVQDPTEELLGAVLFLARPGHVDDLVSLVASANDHPTRLLSAAATAEERRSW